MTYSTSQSGTIPVSVIPIEEYLRIFLCPTNSFTFPPDHAALILNTNVYNDSVCWGLGIDSNAHVCVGFDQEFVTSEYKQEKARGGNVKLQLQYTVSL